CQIRSPPLRMLNSFRSLLYSAIPVRTIPTSKFSSVSIFFPCTSHDRQNSRKIKLLVKMKNKTRVAHLNRFFQGSFFQNKAQTAHTQSHVKGEKRNNKSFDKRKNMR